MKHLCLISLILLFSSSHSIFAQRDFNKSTTKRVSEYPKNIVISMRQEPSKGWGGGDVSPYIVTIFDNGTITYEGIDESNLGSGFSKEIPNKIVKKHAITEKQFDDLLNEFYKIKFLTLNDGYSTRDNGDGTFLMIADGGLATVATSLSIYGTVKTVDNYAFAPHQLVELQRKIYTLTNIANYTKRPAYWLTRFMDDNIPPQKPYERYADIGMPSPGKETGHQLDFSRKWGLFTPCVSTKAEVEKLLGAPDGKYKSPTTQSYPLEDGEMRVTYGDGKNKICNGVIAVNTIEYIYVSPAQPVFLSQLKIDLNRFKSQPLTLRGNLYFNEQDGVIIQTRDVKFSDNSYGEMVTDIQFRNNFKGVKNLKSETQPNQH